MSYKMLILISSIYIIIYVNMHINVLYIRIKYVLFMYIVLIILKEFKFSILKYLPQTIIHCNIL